MRKINTDLSDYIDSYSITALIDEFDAVKEDSEISWNSFGGSVYAGQKLIEYLNSKENSITANVSGIVASMGAVLLPFFDKVIGSKQADVMIHSATGGAKQTLKHSNQFLYEALAKKIDEVKFKEVTGKELKKVMIAEDDERVDVWLTGKQAGYVGLFDETYDLLDKAASLNDKVKLNELDYDLPENIAQKYGLKPKKNNTNNSNDMEIKDVTASELKTGNVDVYNSILEIGKKAEQSRTASIMKYAKYDLEKANALINSGDSLTVEHVEHFMEKKFNIKKVDELEVGSEKKINPAKKTVIEKEDKSTEQKEKEAALEELDSFSGVNDLIEKK